MVDSGRGSTGSSSFQNSKKASCTWGGDTFEFPTCQTTENGARWDKLEKDVQHSRLGFSSRNDMTVHNFENGLGVGKEIAMNNALSKVDLPLHGAGNSPEVTSPHKPKKEFQACDKKEEYKPTQELSKMQKCKGYLKKVAKEKGQAQSQGNES